MDVVEIIKGDIATWPPKMDMMDVSKIKRKFLDCPYSDQSPRQKVDIYLPDEGEGPFPTIIFMHGGAFYAGDKRDVQGLQIIDGIRHGYAVVCVGQRLAGEVTFPLPLFDFKAAIRFLRANATKYRLDGDNFASAGDSAGGYYVVMAAATQDIPAFEDVSMGNAEYSSKVKAVISWFGLYDLPAMLDTGEDGKPLSILEPSIYETFLGAPMDKIQGLMRFVNPVNFISPSFPHVLVQHGTKDSAVPVSQSRKLYKAVCRVCGKDRIEFDEFEGYEHGGFETRFSDKENMDRVFSYLDKYLK